MRIKETMNMSIEFHPSTSDEHPNDVLDGADDVLVEEIWRELDKLVPRERVRFVVAEIALGFQDVRVNTYLPIFIHRRALEQLKLEINEIVSKDSCSLVEQ
jgi:hypothetical protein